MDPKIGIGIIGCGKISDAYFTGCAPYEFIDIVACADLDAARAAEKARHYGVRAASVEALMRAIGQNITYDSMVVIFGCRSDKDIPGMLDLIQLGADKVIFTDAGSPRAANPSELAAEYMERSGKMAQVAKSLSEALDIAERAVTRDDLVCITGSFYLVGHAKQHVKKRYTSPTSPILAKN